MQTLRVNNSRILRTKNAKFSEHYFYLNTNMYGNFQICISVPLRKVLINFAEKETLTQVLSFKLCEIFKNTFFYRTPLAADSVYEFDIYSNFYLFIYVTYS